MTAIYVTKNAWSKMSQIINLTKNKYGFIYSATSGGCNGFNFELSLLEKKLYGQISQEKFHTTIVEPEGNTKLYIDPSSEMHLLGTTIDYIHEDYSKGEFESKFNFEINKDIMTSCGCGISFSPKKV